MKFVSVVMDDDRKVVGLECKDKSLTQQSLADEVDINKIVKRFEQTGLLSHVANKPGVYGDFSAVADYQSAMIAVNSANAMFMSLPASVRERFDNDPVKLIAFVSDSKNRAEAKELGLLAANAVVEPVVPVVPSQPVSNPSVAK